jgi:hypothetical protein
MIKYFLFQLGSIKYILKHIFREIFLMTAIGMREPKFHHKQRVRFIGGEGVVQNYESEFGGWTYLVEMALGPEPDFGRIGAETMVLLNETELHAA